MPDSRDDLSPCEEVRELVQRHLPYWEPYWDAMDEEDAFLDGDRYVDNEDFENRDRRLVQIRGRETEDTIRHMVAVWSTKPRNLQAKGIDRKGDQQSGEFMVGLIEQELQNPYKGFEREFYKAIMAAREHRLGIVWMDWEPDYGPWGEIFDSEVDARSVMWDPAFHPHHPKCGWVRREMRLYVDEAREMYDAPWLEPDRNTRTRQRRADRILLRGQGTNPELYDDDRITLWQCWYKNDRSKKYRDKKNGKEQKLRPQDRYMSCDGGCGYRSPRQSDSANPYVEPPYTQTPGQLPEEIIQACPTCGGDLVRVDVLGEQEAIYAYERGKKLTILPALQQNHDDEPLYIGKWPVPRARSFPGLFVFCQVRSGARVMGHSDTSWGWDQQIASDQLATLAVERTFAHRDYVEIPAMGITDTNGRRFEMRDDQRNVMIRDDSTQFLRPNPVQFHPGVGLDPSWQIAYGAVQQKLTQYSGNTDLGLTEESSKDIAASSIAQQIKQKNIPVEDFVKRTRREFSIYCGVRSDYITATYPPERLVRLNLEGTEQILQVWGQDLPGFDFEIEDTPEFTGQEKARAETWQALEAVFEKYLMQGYPLEAIAELVRVYAEEMHLAPSTVEKFLKAMMTLGEAQMQMQQQQLAQQNAQNQTAEDEAAADLEAGMDVEGMPPFAPTPEQNGMGMSPSLSQ